jgi:hypothetical protein
MNAPQEVYQEINDAPYEIKLTKEDMGGESAQENVGNNRVMDLLKELETARKEHEYDPTATAKTITSDQPKTEITDVKSKSPIGS